MHILLLSPLYPPDIAEPAPYVKELAARLSRVHKVTVLVYGHLPEQVPGVRIIAVDKRRPLPARLLAFIFSLVRESRNTDLIYIQNGASVELPMSIVSLFVRRPFIMHWGDEAAHLRASRRWPLRLIERFAESRARATLAENPLPRPELMPFGPRPEQALKAYEQSWQGHMHDLAALFNHVI